MRVVIAVLGVLAFGGTAFAQDAKQNRFEELIARHASANGIPVSLVHRVVRSESGYNPRAVGRDGAMGLMQIKTATARGVGYEGSPSGLLDPATNLTYGIRYLAGAYRVANGNADRAVSYYRSGYYYAAKRAGLIAKRPSARHRHAKPLNLQQASWRLRTDITP